MPNRRHLLAGLATLAAPCPALAAATTFWTSFRDRFVLPEGRVLDSGNGGVSHSEGQSYGLIFAEAAGDRETFERIWRWTDRALARQDVRLFSWRYDPRAEPTVADLNNATDGELMIAWALMRAARRWREPAYAQAAGEIRAAVAAHLIVEAAVGPVLLPGLAGFQKDASVTLNPSYYVWPALDAFALAEPEGPWTGLIAAGEGLLLKARFGAHGLPSDWVSVSAVGGVSPAKGWPTRFSYDAIRVPLYLAWSGRSAALAAYRAYWSPSFKAGASPPAWVDVVSGEPAPYLSAGGLLEVAQLSCDLPVTPSDWKGDYYSTALSGLVRAAADARR